VARVVRCAVSWVLECRTVRAPARGVTCVVAPFQPSGRSSRRVVELHQQLPVLRVCSTTPPHNVPRTQERKNEDKQRMRGGGAKEKKESERDELVRTVEWSAGR